MRAMIENLINGNISTARKQAKRFRLPDIEAALREEYGWSETKALRAAVFLKTGEQFQAYCDAV